MIRVNLVRDGNQHKSAESSTFIENDDGAIEILNEKNWSLVDMAFALNHGRLQIHQLILRSNGEHFKVSKNLINFVDRST